MANTHGRPARPARNASLITALDEAHTSMAHEDRRRRRTRFALLEAGQALFASQHYGAVSVDDIAAMADVAKASFYNHFPDKESLATTIYGLVHDHVVSLIDEDWQKITTAPERLVRGSFIALRFGLKHPVSGAALYRLTRDLLSLRSPLNARAGMAIAEGLASGEFSEAQAEDGTVLVIGAVSALVQQAIEGDLNDRILVTAERVGAGLLRALGVAPAEASRIAAAARAEMLG